MPCAVKAEKASLVVDGLNFNFGSQVLVTEIIQHVNGDH
jgi:hypothetical protein